MMVKSNTIKIYLIWLLFAGVSVNAQEKSNELFGGPTISTNGYGAHFQSFFHLYKVDKNQIFPLLNNFQ